VRLWPAHGTTVAGHNGKGRRICIAMDTYNIYMDEIPTGSELEGEAGYEVEFRVVVHSQDDGDPENNAVLAGLDLVDLINLRDAIQGEIDNFALIALEAESEEGGETAETES
jgi:hypothetical protein